MNSGGPPGRVTAPSRAPGTPAVRQPIPELSLTDRSGPLACPWPSLLADSPIWSADASDATFLSLTRRPHRSRVAGARFSARIFCEVVLYATPRRSPSSPVHRDPPAARSCAPRTAIGKRLS